MNSATRTAQKPLGSGPSPRLRMLYCYRGWNSGTNAAVMKAWQDHCPEVELLPRDLKGALGDGVLGKLRALPVALRRGGPAVLTRGQGLLTEAAKRSAWFLKSVGKAMDKLDRTEDFHACLAMGSVWPRPKFRQPYFLYTDLTILANLDYPGGNEHVKLWQECLPMERECLAGATQVFTMSDHVTRSLREQYGLPASRITRVNGGCNVPVSQAQDPQRYSRQAAIFVGVDWERKGGPELVEAFCRVRNRHPGATLTIVGCCPDIQAEGVHVVGPVPQEQVTDFLARSSLFCLPSRREPFGIAYLEAMRAGLPVIATDLGAAPDFVLNGQTGYRVPANNVDVLAARLDEMLSDATKCEEMGHRGQELVVAEYTWEKTQQRMWDVIRQVLGWPESRTCQS